MATISDLQKGLVLHLTMNSEDVDSGKVRDRSAYDNHGTINGPKTGLPGVFEESFIFDGSDDYIDIPNDLFSGKNAATTTAWVNPKSLSSNAGLIQQEDSWYFQLTSGNELVIAPHGDSGVSGGNLSTGKWHFVVFSWKANDFYKGYVDGNLVINQSSSVGSLNNSSYEASIGWRDNQNYYLDGKISDVRIYNRALSQPEIKQLYNQRSSRTMSVGGANVSNVTASGGNEYTKTVTDVDYKIHEFTSDGTFSVDSGGEIETLIVAGGGGGGGSGGGGGGAGGLVFAKEEINSGSYSVTVGSGGSGGVEETSASGEGGDSSFLSYTATGGGGGGTRGIDNGHNGGSGGGGNKQGRTTPGSGVSGQGHDGGYGNNYSVNGVAGGGGGAGEQGQDETRGNGGDGGIGRYFGDAFSEDFGDNGFFAGGGGGSAERFVGSGGNGADNGEVISVGDGGKGGGGRAGGRQGDSSGNGVDATDGTGGGGGGANQRDGSDGTRIGGDGGSGIVLIRYKD